MSTIFDFPLISTYSSLPADPEQNNYVRQVSEAFYSFANPVTPSNPSLVHVSSQLLNEWNVTEQDEENLLKVLSGQSAFNQFKPYAMAYAGHQFGQWAGQLGDGRAINIAEIEVKNQPKVIQLKGAGPTPFSRRGDGFAVLRSSIREYLCSEAMHNLGVPTTRALSLVKTGDWIARDMLYNGNVEDEQGAIVSRVAPSFVRFGNFEFFAATKDTTNLKRLADHVINVHYPRLGEPNKQVYIAFFKEVVKRTKKLMIEWERVGFVHGVMNTDNLSILGLTIDYGPYGWLEEYDPGWTPNTTDAQQKRYRFGNQANVGLWNLTQLANALYPLIEEVDPLQEILDDYKNEFTAERHRMMCHKIGLFKTETIHEEFIHQLTELLRKSEVDMTLFYREISSVEFTKFKEFWHIVKETSYFENAEVREVKKEWKEWFNAYLFKIHNENFVVEERLTHMKKVNPKYVLRNYMAQLAIDQAETGNYTLIDELYTLLQNPYSEQPEMEKWYAKRPEWARNKVGCSMLSCSS